MRARGGIRAKRVDRVAGTPGSPLRVRRTWPSPPARRRGTSFGLCGNLRRMHSSETTLHRAGNATSPRGGRWWASVTAWHLLAAVLILSLGGCARASHRAHRPVSIDARPSPPQPPPEPASRSGAHPPATAPASTLPAHPALAAVTPVPAHSRMVSDTLAAHAVLERCGRRRLLPDQESIVDSARQLLAETRAAAMRGDATRAESLARQVRQLTSSLDCR